MAEQKEGCYPRLNGSMLQAQNYDGMIVSVVGKLINNTTLQAADGTNLTVATEHIQDGLVHNPDMCVEIIGQVVDATSLTVRKAFLEDNILFVNFLTCAPPFLSIGICRSRTIDRYGFRPVQSNACRPTIESVFSVLSSSCWRYFQLVVQFIVILICFETT